MAIVLNRARGYKKHVDIVIIDRTGPWGNPYMIGEDGDREEVCNKYEDWLNEWIKNGKEIVVNGRSNKWVVENAHTLKGKDFACWCFPSKCHGEILIKLANL